MLDFALVLQQPQVDPVMARHLAMTLLAIMPIVALVILAVITLPFWFICKKAGFSPWLSLLNVVPLGGIILVYVLAFADWKVVPAPQQAYYPPQPPYTPPSPVA